MTLIQVEVCEVLCCDTSSTVALIVSRTTRWPSIPTALGGASHKADARTQAGGAFSSPVYGDPAVQKDRGASSSNERMKACSVDLLVHVALSLAHFFFFCSPVLSCIMRGSPVQHLLEVKPVLRQRLLLVTDVV